jgi:hypothetical protein
MWKVETVICAWQTIGAWLAEKVVSLVIVPVDLSVLNVILSMATVHAEAEEQEGDVILVLMAIIMFLAIV